jgi:hypothetical protein
LNKLLYIESFNKSAKILNGLGVNIINMLEGNLNDNYIVGNYVFRTAINISFIDLFRKLGIIATGYIGNSLGKLACAYCDGCLDMKETLLVSYRCAKVIKDCNFRPGLMATIGLSWEACLRCCPSGVVVSGHNSQC